MHLQMSLVVAGLIIGFIVGMTGMGGGALMTPVLVLFFGIPPLAAVSSDLVVSAVMKPVGGFVHLRQGTVNLRLVGLLCVGSVPSAFCGVLVSRALGHGSGVQQWTKLALGVALLLAAAGLLLRAYHDLVARGRRLAARRSGGPAAILASSEGSPLRLRPGITILVGIAGGLIVGMTSVGSGSLIIIALLALYPGLSSGSLVGTDLVQAIPLVASAAIGHLLFGDFKFDLTASLLIGCLPGVYLGARVSARAPAGVVRRALTLVLLASGLKLLGVSDLALVVVLVLVVVAGPPVWMLLRSRNGLPARPRLLPRAPAAAGAASGSSPSTLAEPSAPPAAG